MPDDVPWDPAVWEEIDAAILAEVGKVRVAQKVFATTVLPNNPTEVRDDVIRFPDFSIEDGRTKPFVEISQRFSLTAGQVAQEPTLKTAKGTVKLVSGAAEADDLGVDTQPEGPSWARCRTRVTGIRRRLSRTACGCITGSR